MKVIFIVQGEGRGHLTQALALSQLLRQGDHDLLCCMVSVSTKRQIPQYFLDEIKTEVVTFSSLTFGYDRQFKGINYPKTVLNSLSYFFSLKKNINVIKKTIDKYKPDLVINFYEFGCGLYHMFNRKGDYQLFSIAHQYTVNGPTNLPLKFTIHKLGFRLANRMNAYKSDKILALSYAKTDFDSDRIISCPPLISRDLPQMSDEENQLEKTVSILVYIVNPGYSQEIIASFNAIQSDNVHVDVFWDGGPATYEKGNNLLNFRPLSRTGFMDKLSKCQIYFSTSGFESICEAALLQKRIYVVPVANHFEQYYNALDAEKNGIASYMTKFDFNQALQHAHTVNPDFTDWVNESDDFFKSIFS